MPKKELVEVTYTCKCGHKQTVRYFSDDSILPATCCVNCRAGFNTALSYAEMAMRGVAMLQGKPIHV
jgi:hypothetical protein